jgi:mannose-6-phosphate isomerase-like protein (cupin superfamily)
MSTPTTSGTAAGHPPARGRPDLPDQVVIQSAGRGPATWALGSLFEHLAGAGQTGGQLGVAVVSQPPGAATPLHVHTREAEAFYLLAGTMTYRAGSRLAHLAAGDFIYLPHGVPHAFRISGDIPARFLALTVPGGLMDLYDEAGRPAPEHRLPSPGEVDLAADVDRWLHLAPGYGLQIIGPPMPGTDAAPASAPAGTRGRTGPE